MPTVGQGGGGESGLVRRQAQIVALENPVFLSQIRVVHSHLDGTPPTPSSCGPFVTVQMSFQVV